MKQTRSNEKQDTELAGLERMSVKECRDLLGDAGESLDDQQVDTLWDGYYNLARIICTQIIKEKRREVE